MNTSTSDYGSANAGVSHLVINSALNHRNHTYSDKEIKLLTCHFIYFLFTEEEESDSEAEEIHGFDTVYRYSNHGNSHYRARLIPLVASVFRSQYRKLLNVARGTVLVLCVVICLG